MRLRRSDRQRFRCPACDWYILCDPENEREIAKGRRTFNAHWKRRHGNVAK